MLEAGDHVALSDALGEGQAQSRHHLGIVGKHAGTHAQIRKVGDDIDAGAEVYVDPQRLQFLAEHLPDGPRVPLGCLARSADGHAARAPGSHGQPRHGTALLVCRNEVRHCARDLRIVALQIVDQAQGLFSA